MFSHTYIHSSNKTFNTFFKHIYGWNSPLCLTFGIWISKRSSCLKNSSTKLRSRADEWLKLRCCRSLRVLQLKVGPIRRQGSYDVTIDNNHQLQLKSRSTITYKEMKGREVPSFKLSCYQHYVCQSWCCFPRITAPVGIQAHCVCHWELITYPSLQLKDNHTCQMWRSMRSRSTKEAHALLFLLSLHWVRTLEYVFNPEVLHVSSIRL